MNQLRDFEFEFEFEFELEFDFGRKTSQETVSETYYDTQLNPLVVKFKF